MLPELRVKLSSQNKLVGFFQRGLLTEEEFRKLIKYDLSKKEMEDIDGAVAPKFSWKKFFKQFVCLEDENKTDELSKCRSCQEDYAPQEGDHGFCLECQKDIYDDGLPPLGIEEE